MLKNVFFSVVRILCTVAFVVSLTSCFSIFSGKRVATIFKPPESREGKLCVAECKYARNNCLRECSKSAQDCAIKEKKLSTVSNMVGIVGDFIKGAIGSIGEKNKTSHSSCTKLREECSASCEGDSHCSAKCQMEYNSCWDSDTESEVNFNFGKHSTSSKEVCSTKKCDYWCEDDYATCFVGCGGSIYVEIDDQANVLYR